MPDVQPFAGLSQEQTQLNVTELLQEIALRLADIADSVGNLSPDVSGRLRVNAEALANIAQITTVTNVLSVGGQNMLLPVNLMMLGSEAPLRANIVFS